MAVAKTTASLISIGTETREVSVNTQLADFFSRSGAGFTFGAPITIKRGANVKRLIMTLDTFEDDPPGKLLRLNNKDIKFFGFALGERIAVKYDSKAKIMTLLSAGAK